MQERFDLSLGGIGGQKGEPLLKQMPADGLAISPGGPQVDHAVTDVVTAPHLPFNER